MLGKLIDEGVISPEEFNRVYLPTLLRSNFESYASFDLTRVIILSQLESQLEQKNGTVNQMFQTIVESLLEISDTKILAIALTILSDNTSSEEVSAEIVEKLIQGVGSLPIVKEEKVQAETTDAPAEKKYTTRTVIKPDGTYGEEIVEVSENQPGTDVNSNSINYKLRDFCVSSFDFCYSLVKSIARVLCNLDLGKKSSKKIVVNSVIYICELLKFHQSSASNESHLVKRVSDIIRMISSKQYISNNRYTFRHLLNKESAKLESVRSSAQVGSLGEEISEVKLSGGTAMHDADDLIVFRQLEPNQDFESEDAEEQIEVRMNDFEEEEEDFTSKLERLIPLTGNVVSEPSLF